MRKIICYAHYFKGEWNFEVILICVVLLHLFIYKVTMNVCERMIHPSFFDSLCLLWLPTLQLNLNERQHKKSDGEIQKAVCTHFYCRLP